MREDYSQLNGTLLDTDELGRKTSSDMAQVFVLGPVLFNSFKTFLFYFIPVQLVAWISLMTHSIYKECKMQRTPHNG